MEGNSKRSVPILFSERLMWFRTLFLWPLLPALGFQTAAQDPASLKFEVASVKPAGPVQDGVVFRAGPGTDDPERITYSRVTLLRLLHYAYSTEGYDLVHGLDWDQFSGPDWLASEYYYIDAKVPPGTTKEQLRLMWQSLLAERFHLRTHLATKEFTVYELSVAKGGSKLRRSGEGPAKQEPGFPVPAAGSRHGMSMVPPRNVRQTFRSFSMAEFIQMLAWTVSAESSQVYPGYMTLGKVVDKTGLDGTYDFTLEFAGRFQSGAYPAPLPDGQLDTAPDLFTALQQQLGLKLEEKKAPLNVLVVDHVDRVPTEN